MQTPILTLFKRIEPIGKKGKDALPDTVSTMTFVGRFAVSTVDKGELAEGEAPVQIHVVFDGILYRFPATEVNCRALEVCLGKLGGLG